MGGCTVVSKTIVNHRFKVKNDIAPETDSITMSQIGKIIKPFNRKCIDSGSLA